MNAWGWLWLCMLLACGAKAVYLRPLCHLCLWHYLIVPIVTPPCHVFALLPTCTCSCTCRFNELNNLEAAHASQNCHGSHSHAAPFYGYPSSRFAKAFTSSWFPKAFMDTLRLGFPRLLKPDDFMHLAVIPHGLPSAWETGSCKLLLGLCWSPQIGASAGAWLHVLCASTELILPRLLNGLLPGLLPGCCQGYLMGYC